MNPVSHVGPAPARRSYLDWLRGVAVLVMIDAHVLDSWTRFPDRESREFGWMLVLGGMGAPLFLFLAGVAVSMSAGAKYRRSGDVSLASRAVMRRGLEIFGLAFLFRFQAWVLSHSSPRTLLKVDILNIMGPSLMAAAALWGAARTIRNRIVVFAVATLAIAFLSSALRKSLILIALPEPLEAYFRPVPGLSNFVFFPWAAFVFGGALTGVMIDAAVIPVQERRLNVWLGVGGLTVALASFALSYVRNPFMDSYFWTTSPAFLFLRLGLMTSAVAFAYAWESRPGGITKWSPLAQLGRTSLFIYWIHVEIVYGVISRPLHKSLSFAQVGIAFAIFVLFMLTCSMVKDRVVQRWRNRVKLRDDERKMMS